MVETLDLGKRISQCRVCSGQKLESLVDLGAIAFTGIFPKRHDVDVPKAPLEVVMCPQCHLVQLAHNFEKRWLFGDSYGYRSGLNKAMVGHLEAHAQWICDFVDIKAGDKVLDIGSNDGTFINAIHTGQRYAIDPLMQKFQHTYDEDVIRIAGYFPINIAPKNCKIITSMAVFYDLENPIEFAYNVAQSLAPDGVWMFEQSYLPTMIANNSFDTICHEHLEYYSLEVLKYILDVVGMKIIDVALTPTNGGSIRLVAAKKASSWPVADLERYLMDEYAMTLNNPKSYVAFVKAVAEVCHDLYQLIRTLTNQGHKVFGYGASTKGNTILGVTGLNKDLIPAIADVNNDKWGRYTPGTQIPIMTEEDVMRMGPDYLLVLPWHFRDEIIKRERNYLDKGGKLIFPLPTVEVYGEKRQAL